MKKFGIKSMLAAIFLCGWTVQLSAQGNYSFQHGPYLQGLTENEVNVFFTTSGKGFSKVEVREEAGEDSRFFVTVESGLIEANNTQNAIRIHGLNPATTYRYRLISKEIADFQPYKVTFGDSIASPWYTFRTLDPSAETCAFIAMSDIHEDNGKYRALLSHMPLDSAQMVFLVGDIINYFHKPDQPYTGFIDLSVEEFATEKPFVVVRGNHETRGHLARTYPQYIHRPDGHFYGLYRIGDTAVVMLDCGEDKPDGHPVYAGLTAFDDYRKEQQEWLRETVATDEYRNAAHRIVMIHIPPINMRQENGEIARETDHGVQHIYDLYMPILNTAGVDLMICGHTHWPLLIEPEKEEGYNFPVVVNDNKSASFVRVTPDGIHIRTVNTEGETTLDRKF